MLHDPLRHETLTDTRWNPARARSAIERIFEDTEAQALLPGVWPVHPLEPFPAFNRGVYMGAAGVILALHQLAEAGFGDHQADLYSTVADLLEPNRTSLSQWQWLRDLRAQGLSAGVHGLLLGDAGILLLQGRLHGTNTMVEPLGAAIDENSDNVIREFMWGSPGTMLASIWLHEATGAKPWAGRFVRDADLLGQRMIHCVEVGCYLWEQALYGHKVVHVGAVHGFAGNAFAILRGWDLLAEEQRKCWSVQLAESLRRTALAEDGLANWPQSVGTHRPGRTDLLVQHCHGAAGMVSCFAGFPDPSVDDLLLAGGELIWKVGPLKKGAGFCHGTAGNGFAFLKLFVRTEDALWLERARRFAMHAIEQSERALAVHGRRRYTLWTGDLGLAIFLANCISGTAQFPTFDII
jgi:hypothetical protein